MKIVFVSNYLNHHQIPFCNYMKNHCDQFDFIATDIESVQGYQEKSNADYVYIYNEENKFLIKKKIIQADFVIFGSTPNELIKLRMEKNKLSFFYSERFYKKGVWRRWNPRTLIKLYDKIIKYRNLNIYILCASAFLPYDLKLIGFPTEKCYRWGYFPDVVRQDFNNLYSKKNNKDGKKTLIWVGRLIELKHPEIVVKLSEYLKNAGYDFEVTIIGDGPMRNSIQKSIIDKKLENHIQMVGSKNQKEVREYMEHSSIFLFTSARGEGWGAVLNEAMSSGCTPVCSHIIGSVPFLIRNNENGFIYKYGNQHSINSAVRKLLDDPDLCKEMSRKSYEDMIYQWNAEIAAKRLLILANNLIIGKESEYDSGPCSKVTLIKDNWFNET